MQLSRRLLLRAAAWSVGWAALGWLPAKRGSAPRPALLALLSDPESGAVVGRAFLAGFPAERARVRLERELWRNLEVSAHTPARRLRAQLSRAVKRDFATGNVVVVAGWTLSRTEARLAALAALELDTRRPRWT